MSVTVRYLCHEAGRCDSPGNVAIFYFCGHGLEDDEQQVLASDFGATERSPWHNAIAIDSTTKGLWHRKAETQCVFIDACRGVTPATQSTLRIDAPALAMSYSDANPINVRYPLEVKAVARTEQAFGKPGEVSYFTEVLLRALLGAAGEEDDGTGAWVVTTGSVASKFLDVLEDVAPIVTLSKWAPRERKGVSVSDERQIGLQRTARDLTHD